MIKSRILMKIFRKVDMINDCICLWLFIWVSKLLIILCLKKVMGKFMVLWRKLLIIFMLICFDIYSIRWFWIKLDVIELNVKIIFVISMVFINWILLDLMLKFIMDWDMKGESSLINIFVIIFIIICFKYWWWGFRYFIKWLKEVWVFILFMLWNLGVVFNIMMVLSLLYIFYVFLNFLWL